MDNTNGKQNNANNKTSVKTFSILQIENQVQLGRMIEMKWKHNFYWHP